MLFKYGNCTRLLKIKKQAENRLFLQIKWGRILDILWVFLIKHYSTTLVGYEMIIANPYPTRTRGMVVYIFIVDQWADHFFAQVQIT